MALNWFRWFVFVFAAVSLLAVANAVQNQRRHGPAPIVVDWSKRIYGPDGPWHAVTVGIGTPIQHVDLQFAHIRMTWPLAPQWCGSDEACPERKGGYYRVNSSSTANPVTKQQSDKINSVLFRAGGGFDWPSSKLSASTNPVDDTLQIYSNGEPVTVHNASIAPLSDARFVTEFGGTKSYPVTTGGLSIGSPLFTLPFEGTSPPWPRKDFIPALYESNRIESISFSLSLGSPSVGLKPQLILGGYDSAKLYGPVFSEEITIGTYFYVGINAIGIGTEHGKSPYKYGDQTNLLHGLQGKKTYHVKAATSFLSPYLALPRATCYALARHLPIKYDDQASIFVWDINDPTYHQIFSSPSYLYLNFTKMGGDPASDVKIKIPFRLLHLEIDGAIPSPEPTPYFPCLPVDEGETPVLGKAFLQAVVIGIKWNPSPTEKASSGRIFLAQRGGPGEDQAPHITSIDSTTTSLFAEMEARDWPATWQGYWNMSTSPRSSSVNQQSSDGGLSTAGKVGIAVGVSVAVVILAALLLLAFIRRRRTRKSKATPQLPSQASGSSQESSDTDVSSQGRGLAELENNQKKIIELPGQERQPEELESPVSPTANTFEGRPVSTDIVSPVTGTFTGRWPSALVSPISPTFPHTSSLNAAISPPSYSSATATTVTAELEDPRAVEKSGFLVE